MKISVKNNMLSITLSKSETLLSIKHSLNMPLRHVKRVHAKQPKTVWREIKAPGSFLPGVVKAGTYYTPRGKEFWCVTRNTKPLVIELKSEKYKRLVLGVKNNKTWIKKINGLI